MLVLCHGQNIFKRYHLRFKWNKRTRHLYYQNLDCKADKRNLYNSFLTASEIIFHNKLLYSEKQKGFLCCVALCKNENRLPFWNKKNALWWLYQLLYTRIQSQSLWRVNAKTHELKRTGWQLLKRKKQQPVLFKYF